jgi:hypothetical protein
MGLIKFAVAVGLALVAGFLLVGPAVVALVGVFDTGATVHYHGGWPTALAGVVVGAGLLAASAKLLARH